MCGLTSLQRSTADALLSMKSVQFCTQMRNSCINIEMFDNVCVILLQLTQTPGTSAEAHVACERIKIDHIKSIIIIIIIIIFIRRQRGSTRKTVYTIYNVHFHL